MMRSLWSGVSGLQAHQIAMDVEGNNISNVNTHGFKYNRANFADMLSQTPRVATAPQGALGGQNSLQIGLGTGINSTTRIFSQGTLQSTDKNTDMAIQGNGFFIVSPDGGKTKLFTRNGDFLRDKVGNFVNNSGYIVQGWSRDDETGEIDSTAPIRDIVIKEGLTMPARATTFLKVKGNLDSGNDIGNQSSPVYALDQFHNAYDENGNDRVYQIDPKTGNVVTNGNPAKPVYESGEEHVENDVNQDKFYTNQKNQQVLIDRGVNMGVVFDELGNGLSLRDGQGVWISYANAETKPMTIGSNDPNKMGQLDQPGTLDINLNGTRIRSTAGGVASISDVARLINEKQSETGVQAVISAGNQLTLVNLNNSNTTAKTKNIHLQVNANGTQGLNPAGTNNVNGITAQNIITAYQYTYSSAPVATNHAYDDSIARRFTTTEDLRAAMMEDAQKWTNYNHTTYPDTAEFAKSTALANNSTTASAAGTTDPEKNLNDGVLFTVTKDGRFKLENPKSGTDDRTINLSVTGLTKEGDGANQAISENQRLKNILSSLSGSLSPGQALRQSSKMMMASHGSTVEIYDSLGSKHEVSLQWRKTGMTTDGGTEWSLLIQVPEPAEINFSGVGPKNAVTGSMRFNADGSLASFYPAGITFTANNGSLPGQNIQLDFGLGTDFNGMTSFDKESTTQSTNQDGYDGGILKDLKVDENGVIIGAFSNGNSYGLAQVAMATFTNNEGLEAQGDNVFKETANSGQAVIGTAGTGDRGKIAAAKLEASNVDLSRSLTELIVIQRGFQANSKTITTSDEMLNTLLQLKN